MHHHSQASCHFCLQGGWSDPLATGSVIFVFNTATASFAYTLCRGGGFNLHKLLCTPVLRFPFRFSEMQPRVFSLSNPYFNIHYLASDLINFCSFTPLYHKFLAGERNSPSEERSLFKNREIQKNHKTLNWMNKMKRARAAPKIYYFLPEGCGHMEYPQIITILN